MGEYSFYRWRRRLQQSLVGGNGAGGRLVSSRTATDMKTSSAVRCGSVRNVSAGRIGVDRDTAEIYLLPRGMQLVAVFKSEHHATHSPPLSAAVCRKSALWSHADAREALELS
jgi:hypothetical protein